jgi:1-acyl-sn-glycerol-3-phosphate acyltransferase
MIAPLVRIVTGAQARWTGCEPVARQRIYFGNHVSNLDGPVIWATLPEHLRATTRPVAARDYWTAGPLRRWLADDVLHAVLIERKHITATNNPMVDMEAAIDAGSSLIIFPEGRRQVDEDAGMFPFKPGLWHLARRRPGLELIPVHLANLNRMLPRGEFLFVPVMATVTFGAPLPPPADGEDKQAFLDRARRAVADLDDEAEPTP